MKTAKYSRWTPGFTLVEVLVAVSIFVIIVTIAVGGFVTAIRSQRQVAALISANNNVSLALEQMAREIRTGRNFCDSSLPLPTTCPLNQLKFYNAQGDIVTYRLNNGSSSIERGVYDEQSQTDNFERITGFGAFVWNLDFFVKGDTNDVDDPVNLWPTRVTIVVSVSAKEPGISANVIRLQTTVSSRQRDE